MKLNIGSGNNMMKDYINIDLHPVQAKDYIWREMDIMHIDTHFTSNSVDEIYASHLFEHLSHYEITTLLFKLHGILKPSGKLIIITPNFLRMILKLKEETSLKEFSSVDIMFLKFFSTEDESLHKSIWYDDIGIWYLTREGLFEIKTFTFPSELVIKLEAIKI